MSTFAPSYAHGSSSTPLIGETIGVDFDRSVARHADRPGLVVRHQAVQWTYRELSEKVDALAAGLLALDLEPGDRIGIWSPNNAEWVVTQFATAKAGLDPGQHQPRLPPVGTRVCAQKVGCRALITAARFKTSDYIGMINTLAPELSRSTPGTLQRQSFPRCATSSRSLARPPSAPSPSMRSTAWAATATARRLATLADDAAIRRCQSTSNLHRGPRGCPRAQRSRTTTSSTTGSSSARPCTSGQRQGLHPGAALSLLRHGDRQPRVHYARIGDCAAE